MNPRWPTPALIAAKPELAAYAALRACLEIARSVLLANLGDEHDPCACTVCLADVVLLHVDALQRALDPYLDVLSRDPDTDF